MPPIGLAEERAMRLGVFGGTFDPVHYGHLLLAECCREQCRLDEVWFLPTATPPHKQGREPAPAAHRVAMLELALVGHEAMKVCAYEVDRGGVNYTVDTLAHLRQQEPQRELFFLLGADMLADLPHWYRAREVCALALPVVAARGGAGEIDFSCLQAIASPERIALIREHQVDMPQIGISSSEIRRRVAAGRSIRYWTPRAVELYIATHGLYRV
jgi:nicotinate-nucleotide adenylyltransferase